MPAKDSTQSSLPSPGRGQGARLPLTPKIRGPGAQGTTSLAFHLIYMFITEGNPQSILAGPLHCPLPLLISPSFLHSWVWGLRL